MQGLQSPRTTGESRQKRLHSADQQDAEGAPWNISKVTGFFKQLFVNP